MAILFRGGWVVERQKNELTTTMRTQKPTAKIDQPIGILNITITESLTDPECPSKSYPWQHHSPENRIHDTANATSRGLHPIRQTPIFALAKVV